MLLYPAKSLMRTTSSLSYYSLSSLSSEDVAVVRSAVPASLGGAAKLDGIAGVPGVFAGAGLFSFSCCSKNNQQSTATFVHLYIPS